MTPDVAALQRIIEVAGAHRGLDGQAIDRVFARTLDLLEQEAAAAARRRRILWAQRTQERHERGRAA